MAHPAALARDTERGAAIIEFALIFPLFMMLVVGMFSGGQAYNRKQAITAAAREAGRFGATLPVASAGCGGGTILDQWLKCVSDVTVASADGALKSGASDRYVCVAYVYPPGVVGSNDVTKSYTVIDVAGVEIVTYSTADCFSLNGLPVDGFPASTRRVQVVTKRSSPIDVLFFRLKPSLTGSSVTRYEQEA